MTKDEALALARKHQGISRPYAGGATAPIDNWVLEAIMAAASPAPATVPAVEAPPVAQAVNETVDGKSQDTGAVPLA